MLVELSLYDTYTHTRTHIELQPPAVRLIIISLFMPLLPLLILLILLGYILTLMSVDGMCECAEHIMCVSVV